MNGSSVCRCVGRLIGGACVGIILGLFACCVQSDLKRPYPPDFFESIDSGHVSVVARMLRSGAARADATNVVGESAIACAARRGSIEMINLLMDHGARIDQPSTLPPLVPAALNQHVDVVKFLVRRGADPNSRDYAHWTSICYAAMNGNVEIIDLLIAAGADVNVCAPGGRTPLMIAVEAGEMDAAATLLAAGADASLRDDHSRSPIDVAAERGDQFASNRVDGSSISGLD